MNKKYAIAFIVIVVVVVGSVFWVTEMSQRGAGGGSNNNSLIAKFVETVSRAYKPAINGGILPEPPRAQLKMAESFLGRMIEDDIKITYAFADYLSKPSSSYSLVMYATPNPLRWRVDFIMNLEDGEYKSIYLFDGSTYSSCSVNKNTPPDCYRASQTFLENELQTPLPLTEFLNNALDPLTLKKIVPGIKKSSQTQVQKDTRTIATYSADCQIVEDENGILDFCIAKDANILLYFDTKRKTTSGNILEHFTLTAQSVDFSPLSQEIFTSP